jgi:hypothetical protein
MRTRFDAPNILDWEKIKNKKCRDWVSPTPSPLLLSLTLYSEKERTQKWWGEEKISDT